LSITLSSLVAIPLLLLSDNIFRKITMPNVIVFSLSIFVVKTNEFNMSKDIRTSPTRTGVSSTSLLKQ
jgi:hypothetical protein